jgi:hypothetical protein
VAVVLVFAVAGLAAKGQGCLVIVVAVVLVVLMVQREVGSVAVVIVVAVVLVVLMVQRELLGQLYFVGQN